ncbi:MAG: hypothetical protein AAF984_00580 [Verrucomicrobiota bacterium]
MKFIMINFFLLSVNLVNASVFRDTVTARIAGNPPPSVSFVNTFEVPTIDAAAMSNDAVLLLKNTTDYITRAKIASKVVIDDLSEADHTALIFFLSNNIPVPTGSFGELSTYSLRNDLLVKYIHSDENPHLVGQLMLHIVLDTSQSIIWREYVLQYFVDFYERTWVGAVPEYLTELRDAFQSVIANCLFEKNSLCGTSFINLVYLCVSCPEFELSVIKQVANIIAQDVTFSEASRISAIQALGEIGDVASTRIAVQILGEQPSPSVGIQLAVLGALKKNAVWHADVSTGLENFLSTTTHANLRYLAKKLTNN